MVPIQALGSPEGGAEPGFHRRTIIEYGRCRKCGTVADFVQRRRPGSGRVALLTHFFPGDPILPPTSEEAAH